MRLRISKQADADLDAIWLYVANDRGSEEPATRLLARITRVFGLLLQFPLAGRSSPTKKISDLRTYAVLNYIVYYRSGQSVVHILRVVHGNRMHFGAIPEK